MTAELRPELSYVIKAGELVALNYLDGEHPSPVSAEWIDRGTDRHLSPTRLDEFFRTYHRDVDTPSVLKLREAAGLRVGFDCREDRHAFARAIHEATIRAKADAARLVTAIHPTMEEAEQAVDALVERGVPVEAIALLWQANAVMGGEGARAQGHPVSRVLASVSAGGVAGAAMGFAMLTIPGVGPVAVAGAVIASAYSSVATACGVIGATGAAMATMLSDQDVESVAANHRETQLKRGRIFMTVDAEASGKSREEIASLLEQNGASRV